MKKWMMSVVGVAVAIVTVSAFGESTDAPSLLSPNGTAAPVAIHTDAQKTFLSKSMADRRAYAMTAVGREAMRTEATGRWPNAKQSDNPYAMPTSGAFPQWVTLTWTGDGPFTVEVFRKADGKLFFQQTNVYAEFAQVFNCELDTEYVWRVSNAAGISETATFKTDNVFPRLLWDHDELGQIYGVRDLGGAKGRHGLVVKQGLLIRSSDPMKGATSYAMDTAFWTGTALDGLGIRCELDLRSAEETGYATESAFGEGVIYDNDEINSYQDIFEADETAAFKAALDVALNPENYPLNFHGEIGMDRTGSLALVLEALLGMSKDDIMRDYESSWFWYKPNDRPMDEAYNQINRLLTCFENFEGSTFNAKVASYCFSIGVTQAQLDAFRTAMLGEGGAAPTEDDASIARGDVDFVTLPTGMAGYGYVVSNLTATAEIRPDNGGRYALPIGAKVGIYAVAEEGYVIVGTNPYIIDEVAIDTAIDASALPTVLPPATVALGDHPHMTAAWTGGDGSVTNAVDGADFRVEEGTTNVRVIFTADDGWEIVGGAVVELGTVTENIDFGEESGYEVPTVRRAAVKYIDADGVEQTKSAGEFDVVTEETRFLTNGWYAVIEDVDIAAKTNIVVEGDVHLILCDGASLTVTNAAMHCAAISIGTNTTLTVYGQTRGTGCLTAKGGAYGAGIGGGHTGDGCGAVAIHGGTITANGGTNAAGIGGCYKNDGGSVTITGGRIAAAAKSASAADIGNGALATSDCAVSISGGVFANPVDVAWCAEGYATVANPDPATAADYPWAVRSAYRVTVGDHPHMAAAWTCGDGSVTNEIEGVSFAVMPPGTNGVQVIFTAEPGWVLVGDAVVDVGEVAGDIAFGDGNDFRVPGVQREPVAYVDADGEERSKAGDEFEVVTSETRFLASGWYVVLDDVEIWAKTNLTVVGDAHLILCDGASLTVANAQSDTAGIAVGGGASLAIYGQAEDTGRLDVTGGVRASGIGGVMDGDCGAIAIHGGTIVANGGFSGAGIGSGPRGSGGSVSITGGRIRATAGSDFAPDIGSGSDAVTNCAVSISGGVFARELQDAWLAPGFAAVANTDAATKDEYPWALAHPVFVVVTVGDHPHLSVAWTCGDGSVTNEIEGTFFRVPVRTTNVKVVFTAEPGWEIVGEAVVNLGTVTEDTVFGDGNDYRAPEARDVCGWCGIDGEAWYFRGGVSLWRIEAAYNEGVMSLRQRNADASGTLDLWGIEQALADVGIGPVSDATLTFESTWGTNGFANVTELIITNRHFAANYPAGSLQPFAGISRLVLGDGETDLTVGSRDVSDPVVTASCSVFGTNFDTLESVEIWGRDVRLRNAFCCYAANATARLADVRVHATGDLDLGWNSFNVSTGSKGGTISNAVFEAGGDLDLGGRALRYSLVSNALVSVSAPPGARVVLGGPHFIGQYSKEMPVTLDWYAPPPVVEDSSALCDSTITWRFPVERAEEYAGIFQGKEKLVKISGPDCRLFVALPPSESADSTADRRDKYGSWQQLKTAGTSADNDGGGTAYWHRFVRIEPGESPTLRPGSGQASFTFVAENTGEMDAALRSVRIESPDIDIISDEDYARYFFVRTEPLGNNRYQLTAVLDPGAVEVESVMKRLAAQLPCETALLAGSPGLWYFVEQAERLEDLGKSFSKPVQANRDGTFSLELAPFKDSAFYRLHVKASESESSADR